MLQNSQPFVGRAHAAVAASQIQITPFFLSRAKKFAAYAIRAGPLHAGTRLLVRALSDWRRFAYREEFVSESESARCRLRWSAQLPWRLRAMSSIACWNFSRTLVEMFSRY